MVDDKIIILGEEFRRIKDFDEYYISRDGKVLSKNKKFKQNKILSPWSNQYGHKYVELHNGKQNQKKLVHRLVAETYIPNPNEYPIVRHLNDNPKDNRVENLVWGTCLDNVHDCIDHNRFKYFSKQDIRKANEARMTPVCAKNIFTGETRVFESQCEAARKLNMNQSTISANIVGKSNRAGYWMFKEGQDPDGIDVSNIKVGNRHFSVIQMTEPNGNIKYFKTQQDAADYLGLTISSLSNYLNGKTKNQNNYLFEYLEDSMNDQIINSFPGYEFRKYTEDEIENFGISKDSAEANKKHNMFRGENVGKGGYVYSVPGMYGPTIALDVSGMHPSSIIAMNYFGEYTEKYENMVKARAAIKHKDIDAAKTLLGENCAKYLDDPSAAKSLSQALKIAQNSCFGLTCASFENPMRHKDNENNIVALRGALFMVTLRDCIEELGYFVCHEKTDCVKVPNWDEKIKNFTIGFGKKYGYNFEVEHSFERFCLVDKANYVGKCAQDDPEHPGEWISVGDRFSEPYVFKTLFSHEDPNLKDMSEVKNVKTSMYIDMNEGLPEGEHNYIFVGKVGQFTPVKDGTGGGVLLRYSGDDENGNPKYAAVEGTKGWRWKETEIIKSLQLEEQINLDYWRQKVDEAIDCLNKFGDAERFLSDDPYEQ